MNQNNLSADPIAMVLGIIAIVIGLAGCCCYGVLAIVPLGASIVGLYLANRSIKEYNANPEGFSAQSRSNVGTAKIINIVAIVLNGLIFLTFLVGFVIYGTLLSTTIYDEIQRTKDRDAYEYEWENDSMYYNAEEIIEVEDDIKVIESDSIAIDSFQLKTTTNK